MKSILCLFFLTRVLFMFGQSEFKIMDDLEPELYEKWTLEFIREKGIKNVSVDIKSLSYKLFKHKGKFDLFNYDSIANEIKFKEIIVLPTLDLGGYVILHLTDNTLKYDSVNRLETRLQYSSDKVKTNGYWQPKSTTKISYEYNDNRLIRETHVETEIRSTKQVSSQYLDSSFIIVEKKSIYDYHYFKDSINVYYSYTPENVINGIPSNFNTKRLRTNSCENYLYKRQYLNTDNQIEMEIIDYFSRIDTIKYIYKGDIIVSKQNLRTSAFDFTYNENGKIISRCMKGDNSGNCSYFEYKFDGNTEFRKKIDGKDITTSKIVYNSDGLITKKIVRYNGKVIIKYKYTYN